MAQRFDRPSNQNFDNSPACNFQSRIVKPAQRNAPREKYDENILPNLTRSDSSLCFS